MNAPKEFISISDDAVKGYLIDTSRFKDKPNFGNATISGTTVKFDLDDVLVYDQNGSIYYARGYLNDKDKQLYYNVTVHRSVGGDNS